MSAEAIIYPAIAMFFLTFFLIMRMGRARFAATASRQVSIKYYQLYVGDGEPPELRQMSRHTQNHFEVPPLFYLAVIFTYATEQVTVLAVVLAWAFFALRVVHSFIHLGANNVTRRFFTFGTSVLVLAGLWGHLLLRLLMQGG